MSTEYIVNPSYLDKLASQLNNILSPKLSFFHKGDRLTQIKRYLLQNKLSIPETVAHIYKTARWRKEIDADTIIASDVMNLTHYLVITPYGFTDNKQLIVSVYCDASIPDTISESDIITYFVYYFDRLLSIVYEESKESDKTMPLQNYIILLANGSLSQLFSMQKVGKEIHRLVQEIVVSHYPCMFQCYYFISNNLDYIPNSYFETPSIILVHTSKPIQLFRQVRKYIIHNGSRTNVLYLSDFNIPGFLPKEEISEYFGGTKKCDLIEWFRMNAYLENCDLNIETTHIVSQDVFEQYGTGLTMSPKYFDNILVQGWFWKMQLPSQKWCHYYFIILSHTILLYFPNENSINDIHAVLLKGCQIVISTNPVDRRREGNDSLLSMKYSLQAKKMPCFNCEEDPHGIPHNYQFVLRTDNEDHIFGFNDILQRSMWLFYINQSIDHCKTMST